jgi:hypothetical protein
MIGLSRRKVLALTGAAAGASLTAAAVGSPALAAPPVLDTPRGSHWKGSETQNGWTVVGGAAVTAVIVEGSDARLSLVPGAVTTLLVHVLRRFHYEVETLVAGGVSGHRADRAVAAPLESNYLSGTAFAVRPAAYPAGSTGNFFASQVLVIRDILADCGGVVRWGGDDAVTPKEGHFQIDVPPGDRRLAEAAAQLAAPGTPPDIWTPARRNRARTLENRQHHG